MNKKQYDSKIEDLVRSMNGLQFATIAQLYEQTETIHYPLSMQDKEQLLNSVFPYKGEVPMLTLVMNKLGHIHVFKGDVSNHLDLSNRQNIKKYGNSGTTFESNLYYQAEEEIVSLLDQLSEEDQTSLNDGYVIVIKDFGLFI